MSRMVSTFSNPRYMVAMWLVISVVLIITDAPKESEHPVAAAMGTLTTTSLLSGLVYFLARAKRRKEDAFNSQHHYDAVAHELHNADLKGGLWARAIAEAGGENDRAKALYIKFRVAQLVEEEQEHAEMQKRAQEKREMKAEEERKEKAELDAHRTRCLFCGEVISALSEVCKNCGRPTF